MSKKARKPKPKADIVEVTYDAGHWRLLTEKRFRATGVMSVLDKARLGTIIHGSVARGDVTKGSDIDIVIPYKIPPYTAVHAIEQAGLEIAGKEIVQATPAYGVKAHIILDALTTVSLPLVDFSNRERMFYKYGGEINLPQLRQNTRTAGVTRNLILIQPTPEGHVEHPVVGHESHVASLLGVPLSIIEERVRVLTRREQVGRTGVFLKHSLNPEESFEEAIEAITMRGLAKFRQWRKILS